MDPEPKSQFLEGRLEKSVSMQIEKNQDLNELKRMMPGAVQSGNQKKKEE